MKIRLYAALSTAAAMTFVSSISAREVPRQFRIWGSKAPEKLSENPIPQKYGIESLRIPANMQKVEPIQTPNWMKLLQANMPMPELCLLPGTR